MKSLRSCIKAAPICSVLLHCLTRQSPYISHVPARITVGAWDDGQVFLSCLVGASSQIKQFELYYRRTDGEFWGEFDEEERLP